MAEMNETLARVEHLQEELNKAQQEGSHSPIVPILQAFSQFYLDYLSKQQSGEEENQKGGEINEKS